MRDKKRTNRNEFQEWLEPLVEGLTLTALAERSGMTYAHVHGLVRGNKVPGPGAIQRLAQALNLSPAETARGFKAANLEPTLPPTHLVFDFPDWNGQIRLDLRAEGRKSAVAEVHITRAEQGIPFDVTCAVDGVSQPGPHHSVSGTQSLLLPVPYRSYRFSFELTEPAFRWSFEIAPTD